MLIDWFTVIAQLVNFLILVWLLKRFLYRPILDAIDAREKKIAKELADADAKKTEAQQERDEFQHKNAEFEQQRSALMAQATEDAKTERQRLLTEARQTADTLSAKRNEALNSEAASLKLAITRRTQKEVFAITRKALSDLATTSLEERLADVFTRRLREMDEPTKRSLIESLKTTSEPVLVRSAFELPEAQRTAIKKSIELAFSAEINIHFETAPELISGIELISNGQKVAWSIADYLTSLEEGVAELLKEKQQNAAQTQAKKSSVLTQQIGKRAYELYEEHGHKTGNAAADWEQAKQEIQEKSHPKVDDESAAEAKTEVKVEPKPVAKSTPKAEPKAEVKPVIKDQ